MSVKKNENVKDFKSHIYKRNLSEKENVMLCELRKVTGIKTNTQAVLFASREYLKFIKQAEDLKLKISSLLDDLNEVTKSI
jgi:hypothetical protein